MTGLRITGWGSALPDNIVTNADLASRIDTSDDWITERTGIKERRIGGTTAEHAINAGRAALDKAGVTPDQIDLIILATTTPDRQVPATASTVQQGLGLSCGAFDLNAACSGFVYGLVGALGFLKSGLDRVLVVGSETLSTIVDWEDRNTCILFADGAGAAVVERTEDDGDLLGFSMSSDGNLEYALFAERGGTLEMDGRAVFKNAVLVMEKAAHEAMEMAGVTPDDIDHVIPHQANIRIIEASCKRLGIPSDKAITVLDYTGNTSSASVPLAMVDALEAGRIHKDEMVLMVGFGAGMTSAATVLRWSADT
ncbi:MAG: ketoacyl-ACP synthase III [Actinomycetia bacterium]|nr:ketoacyl-ACP synthase III [Actinomycetes bacterium]MCP4958792.1 ketoacyl-ACP synthase III [Actinomycetes bacterium]